MSYMTHHMMEARKLRPILEMAAQSLPDETALKAVCIHPMWATGSAYAAGFKVQHNGKLWRAVQAHTAQEGWQPEKAPALWEQINESHTGALNDPIPYEGNMALENGKHYIQNGVIYLCNRDTVIAVYNPLNELVGQYVIIA